MASSITVAGTALAKRVGSDGFRKLLLGKCHPTKIPNASRIVVKKLEFDQWLKMYFAHFEAYIAHDPQKICKTGDVVLIEELPTQLTRDITHNVLRVIYQCGDIIDPITGKPCVAGEYRDEMERKDQLWGKNPNAFDYSKAPPRGWQEGKKDWSHKEGFRKFHEFTDRDQTEAEW